MKSLCTILTIIIMAVQSFAQAQTTFVKTIALDNHPPVFALAGDITVVEWEGSAIRINAVIEITNSSENVIKRLITLGRYNLEVRTENGNMVISAPKMANHISLQGVDLQERMHYEISIPKGTKYQIQPVHYINVLQSI